jgi:hypothetical protein
MSGLLRGKPIAWISAIALLAFASLVTALGYTPPGTGGTAASPDSAEALSCEVEGPGSQIDVNPAIQFVRSRAVAARRAASPVVVLNTRGYNYPSGAARVPQDATVDTTAGR